MDVGSTNANHNIGRAIINGTIHDANKRDSLSICGWDGSGDYIKFLGIKYNVTTGAYGGYTGFDNQSHMSFWTWGNSVSNSREVMRLTSRGKVGIGTTDPQELLHVIGKAIIHNGVGASPANGLDGSDGTRPILWPGVPDNTPYSLGIAGYTLWYTVPTGAIHAFYVGTTERMRIDSTGNVTCTGNLGVGSAAATNGINLNLAAEIYTRIEGSSTNNHTKALSIGGYGLFEMDAPGVVVGRFKIDNNGVVIINGKQGATNTAVIVTDSVNATLKIGFPSLRNIAFGGHPDHDLNFGYFSANADTSFTPQNKLIASTGRVGISNTNPQSMLHLGNCELFGSAPVIIFGKNNGTGFRNAFMGYSESFYFFIGDYGGTNGTNTLTQQY